MHLDVGTSTRADWPDESVALSNGHHRTTARPERPALPITRVGMAVTNHGCHVRRIFRSRNDAHTGEREAADKQKAFHMV